MCKERETIKQEKDIANNDIRKLGADLVEAKTIHKQTEDQHRNQVEELKRQLEILSEDVTFYFYFYLYVESSIKK